MNLLEQLNTCCRRLWRDESGVVLAFTVIVFLSLFVIACSVYAVGENIRQRIELQNAADAAAYSGAVVQADAISRIAAINKALAWTYVQMGRAVMDYDVDAWLELTIYHWNQDYYDGLTRLSSYAGGVCFMYENQFSSIGLGSGYINCYEDGLIKINGQHWYPFSFVTSLHGMVFEHYGILQGRIQTYRGMIQTMNSDERSIRDSLKGNIEATVLRVLTNDISGDNCWYSCLVTDPNEYFRVDSSESHFLQFINQPNTATTAFEDGIDKWFVNANPSEGIQRKYEQNSMLSAAWGRLLSFWSPKPPYGECTPDYVDYQPNLREVKGEDPQWEWGLPQDCYETETVEPLILKPNYFERQQRIVVAVARKMENPLFFMFLQSSPPGLYAFFDPVQSGVNAPYTWSAAASRAGFRDGGVDGSYWTKDQTGWVDTPKNLSQWDWDAELIPLPWVTSVPELWDSPTWKQLPGGSGGSSLGSLAGGTAPDGDFLH